MKMVHGLKMQVLKLSLILVYLFSFNLNAKTLKVDTLTPSVTDGDLTIQRNGSGDIVIGDYTGFLKFLSGAPTAQASIDLTSDITGVLPIANGGTGSATQNFVDLTTNQSIAGDKTVTGQFVAISTTNGNRPCPVMTEAQRDAISSPISGDCIVNSTANELNFYLDGAWSQVGGGGGGGGGGSAGINFVDDPSFENGDLAPDATALGFVSYELYTADSELNSEFNLQHYQVAWSSLSSADAYVRDSFSRTGLDEKQGLFSIWIKSTTVSDQELQLCLRVDDSDFSETCDDAYLLTIKSDDTWRKYEIPFLFGASTVEYEIFNESYTGALEINIDKIYIGTMPDGYIQQVGQAQFVGELTVQGDINCRFENSAASYSEFPDDTGCDGSYSVIGNVSAPPTSKPNIIINNARTDGYYHVEAKALFANVNTSNSCYFTLSDTTSFNNQPVMGLVTTGKQYGYEVDGDFKFNTGGDKTIRILSESSDGTSACRIFADGSTTANLRDRSLKITVHFYPDSNSTIVSQRSEFPVVEASGNGGESITANITDIPFTEVKDDFGLWDGDSFTADRSGYWVFEGSISINVSGSCRVEAYKGTTLFKNLGVTGLTAGVFKFSGVLNLSKNDTLSIRTNCGAVNVVNNTTQHYLHIQYFPTDATIIGKFEQIEEITGDLTAATANELSAKILANGTLVSQNYNWISSISGSAGDYTITFNTGIFNQTPSCQVTSEWNGGTKYGTVIGDSTNSTQVRAYISSTSGTAAADEFAINCSKQGADVNKSFKGAVINASQSAQLIADTVREDIISTDLCQVDVYSSRSDAISAGSEDLVFETEIKDNCNAWNAGGTSGASLQDTYTAQKNGFIKIEGILSATAFITTWGIDLYVNGTRVKRGSVTASVSQNKFGFMLEVAKDDLITIRSTDAFTMNGSDVNYNLAITELPDTASIVENLNRSKVINSYAETNSKIVRTETCRINLSGTHATESPLCDTWIDSLTDNGVGSTTINFKAGIFTDAPVCVASASNTIAVALTDAEFATQVRFRLFNSSSQAARDGRGTITCTGVSN